MSGGPREIARPQSFQADEGDDDDDGDGDDDDESDFFYCKTSPILVVPFLLKVTMRRRAMSS